MKKSMFIAAAAALAAPARATDKEPCAAGMVCASKPETIAAEMRGAGYRATMGTDGEGDPSIDSAGSGYDFSVFFYGCEQAKSCDSIQFYASFENDQGHDTAMINRWNNTKRFGQLALEDDGDLVLRRDLSTVGGLTPKNFADELDWWTTTLGEFSRFLAENREEAAPSAPVI